MDLLQICQEFCRRTGLVVPATISGSVDPQVVQLMGLLNEAVEEIILRDEWEGVTYETTFTTITGEDQGSIETLAPGLRKILSETIYNRSNKLRVDGPISPADWQARKAIPLTGTLYNYRIRQNRLLLSPPGTAGALFAFEYVSRYLVTTEAGVPKASFSLDSDLFSLSDSLAIQALRWKWKCEKGLDYAEDFARFERQLWSEAGGQRIPGQIYMDSEDRPRAGPGVVVPPGSWPL